MLQSIKSFLWIAPFVAFLVGYQVLRFLSHTEAIEVPSIVGMHIHDAIRILSADKLNVRILDEKSDPDAQRGNYHKPSSNGRAEGETSSVDFFGSYQMSS